VTDLGQSRSGLVRTIGEWAADRQEEIVKHRQVFDERLGRTSASLLA
jgi:hypothetical protein